MNALLIAILLAAQDPAPKPYTPDWKPTAAELIALIDKETREPQLRYLLGRAKTLGKEGARVFEHALASDNAWLCGEALDGLVALGPEAAPALPGLVKRLSASEVRCALLSTNAEIERVTKLEPTLLTIQGKRVADPEGTGKALAAVVGSIGKSDPRALAATLAPLAPTTIDRGWSMIHLAFARALNGNPVAASELLLECFEKAPVPERLLLIAGCAQVELSPGPAADKLVTALTDKSADVRRAACSTLVHQRQLDARALMEPMRKLLAEQAPIVRAQAATWLVRFGDVEASHELVRLLSCPDDGIVMAAGTVLTLIATSGERKDLKFPPLPANTVEVLVQVAKSERSMFVRMAVVDVLAALADRSADALTTLKTLATKEDLVGMKARAAVERLEGKRPK